MLFIGNKINQIRLRDILPSVSEENEIDYVVAAIAYGGSASNDAFDLIGNALTNKLRVDLWMRYDETVPVKVEFLRRLLKNVQNNIFTQFVPDIFHSKVIWWKGYGAYIGSANHTDRGWLTNIEAGIFLTQDELEANGMDLELDNFFDYLRELDKTIAISEEYVAHMEELSRLNKDVYQSAKKKRQFDEWQGPEFYDKKTAFNKGKESFRKEWLDTLEILRNIANAVQEYRPTFIDANVPAAWQADQFLHAHYYQRVIDGERANSHPFEAFYQNNKTNPKAALTEALTWWQQLTIDDLTFEYKMLHEHAPILKTLLTKDKIAKLTEDEMKTICSKTHANMDHIIKIPLADLGRPDLDSLDREKRLDLYVPMLLKLRNNKGWDIRLLLEYVLYGGSDDMIWERIYDAARDKDYKLYRYGINTIAELVGWARPEVSPPRNGRTSKALRSLGYDVKVH